MNVEKKRNGDLPVMYDSEKIITRTSWHNNEILVAEIENYMSEETPEYFRINHYAILFITQGTLSGIFNQIGIEMKAPAAAFIFNDHVLHYISSSPDFLFACHCGETDAFIAIRQIALRIRPPRLTD